MGRRSCPTTPTPRHRRSPWCLGRSRNIRIQVFPTLVTVAAGDSLRVTISTTDTPHLVPIPSQLAQLAGGEYNIERTPTSPSALTVEIATSAPSSPDNAVPGIDRVRRQR